MEETSAGAIVFRRECGEIKFLLLKYTNYWGFVKGNIEENESMEQTTLRELEEETGIKDGSFVKGFREEEHYTYKKEKKLVFKTVVFFLIETKTKDVKISSEHENFKWCGYEEAVELLKYENSKKLIEKALKQLKSENQSQLDSYRLQ